MKSGMAHHGHEQHGHSPYGQLGVMALLSFIAMYVLMYAMVDSTENVYPNFNQFYMASLMTAPMVIIELLVMRGMYKNKKLNAAILAGSAVVATLAFFFIQQQTLITDEQFLKSMIPHHAAAVLMCEKAPIKDAEIKQLCDNILSSQQAEIKQMKKKLNDIK
jgi:peptidoglycan/LPS O-acetylase OafA/YrhL